MPPNGTSAAHGAPRIYLQQWVIGPHSYPHNLKVVGSNPTPLQRRLRRESHSEKKPNPLTVQEAEFRSFFFQHSAGSNLVFRRSFRGSF
jgi:hypothetical protein